MMKHTFVSLIVIALSVYSLGGCGSDEGGEVRARGGGTQAGVGGESMAGGGGESPLGTEALGGSTAAGGEATAGAGGAATNVGGSSAGSSSGTTGPGDPDTTVSHANCGDSATLTTTLAARYAGAVIAVTGKTKTYQMTTNWWHKYTDQSVSISGLGYTVNNPSNVNVPQTDGAPIGYPTIFVGTYAGSATVESNLPKKVSDLTTVHTTFESNSLALDTSNFNAAYDVWFTRTGDPLPANQYSPGTGGAFLMVWMFDPAQRQPRGRNQHPAHTVDGVEGTWDVWIDATNPPCISYVSTTPRNSLAYDLNNFIKDSVTNAYGITNDMYLSIVFGGFEIWGGGDGLALKNFCVDVK